MRNDLDPNYYKERVPNVECIDVTEHFNFNRGNAIKYIWRAGQKDDEIIELKKAAWYLRREVERLEALQKSKPREYDMSSLDNNRFLILSGLDSLIGEKNV